jgi:hypothetical protein
MEEEIALHSAFIYQTCVILHQHLKNDSQHFPIQDIGRVAACLGDRLWTDEELDMLSVVFLMPSAKERLIQSGVRIVPNFIIKQ